MKLTNLNVHDLLDCLNMCLCMFLVSSSSFLQMRAIYKRIPKPTDYDLLFVRFDTLPFHKKVFFFLHQMQISHFVIFHHHKGNRYDLLWWMFIFQCSLIFEQEKQRNMKSGPWPSETPPSSLSLARLRLCNNVNSHWVDLLKPTLNEFMWSYMYIPRGLSHH